MCFAKDISYINGEALQRFDPLVKDGQHPWIIVNDVGECAKGAGLAAIPHVNRQALAGAGFYRNPPPLSVRLLAPKAPEFLRRGFQPLPDHRRDAGGWLDMESLGDGLELQNPELSAPLPTDAHDAADPAAREAFAEQAFNPHS